ncbi:hypothetical protein LX32DRAFT_635614 [Colletotrichum zoysiae]|uniref:Uncharacterized protein n=1 Tax=Colletotrichum zoysiae TaxID=1216348 RepID=A0AAD9M656_9PEZI|nr:hypothetical protein LX32DRAFT_635614 [Colletotrichum zoysiae]
MALTASLWIAPLLELSRDEQFITTLLHRTLSLLSPNTPRVSIIHTWFPCRRPRVIRMCSHLRALLSRMKMMCGFWSGAA